MVIHSKFHIRTGAMGWMVVHASVTNELYLNLIKKTGAVNIYKSSHEKGILGFIIGTEIQFGFDRYS